MVHSAHPNYNQNDMDNVIANFPLCGGCSRREKHEGLRDDEFYCPLVENVLPNGIVTNDTDVTDCVNKGWYRPFKNYVEASDSF